MTDSTSLTQSRPKVHPFNYDLSVFTHQEREEEQRQDGLPQLNPFGTDAHQDNQEPQVSEHAEKSGYSEHLENEKKTPSIVHPNRTLLRKVEEKRTNKNLDLYARKL